MTDQNQNISATSSRTRRAILDAAVKVLNRKRSASMSEIAESAGLARSTVHRHFPERADLLSALEAYAEAELSTAADQARLGEGTGAEAILRLSQTYFERADLLMVAYGHLTTDDEIASVDEVDQELVALTARGHADGSIDPGLSAIWVQQFLWSMLYSAWLTAKATQVSRHEALTVFLASFGKVLAR